MQQVVSFFLYENFISLRNSQNQSYQVIRKFFLLLILSFSFSFGIASTCFNSNDSTAYILETKLHYGFLLSHHKYMNHLATGHFPALEINIGKQTNGKQEWHSLYKYPVAGLAFWYADLRNPDVLGYAFALYPYLNFHLIRNPYFLLNFRFGTGLGYMTNKFDRLENYKNVAIGSHLNATVNMFYEFRWKVFRKLFLSGSLGLTHFSNGALKMPNPGLNIPTAAVGVSYLLSYGMPEVSFPDYKTRGKGESKIQVISILSTGVKEIYPVCGNKYGICSFSTSFMKPLNMKQKIETGFDLFWDFSNIQELKNKYIEVNHSYEVIRYGIHLGHQFDFSRLSFITQAGFYLYAKDKSDGPVFMRIALRYRITKKMFFNLALKTHYAKADFVEWGIGYLIK